MSLSLRSTERYTANQGTSIVSFFCRFRQSEKRSVALLVLPALSSAGTVAVTMLSDASCDAGANCGYRSGADHPTLEGYAGLCLSWSKHASISQGRYGESSRSEVAEIHTNLGITLTGVGRVNVLASSTATNVRAEAIVDTTGGVYSFSQMEEVNPASVELGRMAMRFFAEAAGCMTGTGSLQYGNTGATTRFTDRGETQIDWEYDHNGLGGINIAARSSDAFISAATAFLTSTELCYLTLAAHCDVTTFGSYEGIAPAGDPGTGSSTSAAAVDPLLTPDQGAFAAHQGENALCLFTHTSSNITLTPRSVYSCQYVSPRRGACSPWVSRRRSGVADGKNPHPTRHNTGGVGCSLRRRLLRTERAASPGHEVVTARHLSVLSRKVVYGLAR